MPIKLLTIEDATKLSEKQVHELHRKHTNPMLVSLLEQIGYNKKVISASGSTIHYENGDTALDFISGYGSVPFGYRGKPNFLQTHQNCMAAALAHNLAKITPGQINKFFFSNSGTEAVEGAIKTARAASDRYKILSTIGGYHGKTFGALSASGKEMYKTPFSPLVPGIDFVPFNDLKKLELRLSTSEYAAFLVEPIQGEAGVMVPGDGYLSAAQQLCNKYQTFLILDEVQTGFGRTGKMFAADYEGIKPDIIALGKALGGGEAVIAATGYTDAVYKKAYGRKKTCLLHTSTFGGNYSSCEIAINTINRLINENVVEHVDLLGKYILGQLQYLAKKHPMITKVRGRGLLIGIELAKPATDGLKNVAFQSIEKLTANVLDREDVSSMVAGIMLREHGVLLAFTLNNPYVIRIEPALTITKPDIDKVIAALDATFTRYRSFSAMLAATLKSYAGNKLAPA